MRTLGLAALAVVALAVSWSIFAQVEPPPVGFALEQRLQKKPLVAPPPADKIPNGWIMAGSNPGDYTAALDSGRGAYLASKDDSARGFGTMMQMFTADMYRGKRVRMTAQVRAEGIEGWAGLWMRVDGPGSSSLGFDNMQSRPIKGTSGWQRYEIVLDVPEASTNIGFGILLAGKGTAHVDDFAFEVVPTTVPTTSTGKQPISSAPVNLKFDE